MFWARSPEALLILLGLMHLQYKSFLPVGVCLLLVSRDTSAWSADSPIVTTHPLGTVVFHWLPPRAKPDWAGHCAVTTVPFSAWPDCHCSRLALLAHTAENVQGTHTQVHSQHPIHITLRELQRDIPMHQLTLAQNNLEFLSERHLKKAEYLRLPNRLFQIQSDNTQML